MVSRRCHARQPQQLATRMPQTSHLERHCTGIAIVRDIVIGMAAGLTVPCAPAVEVATGVAGGMARAIS